MPRSAFGGGYELCMKRKILLSVFLREAAPRQIIVTAGFDSTWLNVPIVLIV